MAVKMMQKEKRPYALSLSHTPMTDHVEFRITPAFFFKWKISFIMFTYVGEWTINKTNQIIIIRIITRITKSRLFFFLWEIFQYSTTTTKQKNKKKDWVLLSTSPGLAVIKKVAHDILTKQEGRSHYYSTQMNLEAMKPECTGCTPK